MRPVATVLIPARNEEADIEGCLRAVAGQDVGAHRLEVVVADGRSTDRTRTVLDALGPTLGFASFRCVDNQDGGIAAGLNRALAFVTTDVVVRIDARSRIEPHYVRTVCGLLGRHADAGVCGGSQVPIDRNTGTVSAGIARALSNRYTTGLSRYRSRVSSGASDTVWMGAFRTEELRDLGGWDEDLAVNEDYELCERYRAEGSTVWFEASLRSGYLPRADLRGLAAQYHRFGRTKGERWARGARLSPRHAALLSAVPLAAAATLATARRMGWPFVLGGSAAAVLAIDHVGVRAPASMSVRATACLAAVVSDGAWWTGVVAGFVGGRAGE